MSAIRLIFFLDIRYDVIGNTTRLDERKSKTQFRARKISSFKWISLKIGTLKRMSS